MKTLIIILIIASFLQTTVLPVNLGLIILICRAYLRADRANLYLAFVFGIFIANLNLINLGIGSFIYLLAVTIVQALSKLRLAANPLLIVPISFMLLSLDQLASWDLSKILISSFLSLPIFYAIRLWEERFIVQKEIRLKF
ncbi:MAG: hypothetical protein Q7R77_01340 [Candidatus Daviesbacteria bacterium]|nr:hypothetical protein [Candidatus Daviesbacteria bacterium]